LPPVRLRALVAEDTFEVVAVPTGLLFRYGLMRIGVTMFPTRVGIMICIEALSFGTRLAVRSPILSRGLALHGGFSFLWYCDFRADAESDSSTTDFVFLPFAAGLLRGQIENR
jgi:hypothetical protein